MRGMPLSVVLNILILTTVDTTGGTARASGSGGVTANASHAELVRLFKSPYVGDRMIAAADFAKLEITELHVRVHVMPLDPSQVFFIRPDRFANVCRVHVVEVEHDRLPIGLNNRANPCIIR